MRLAATLLAACLLAASTAPAQAGRGLKLHVPSPDWRDQVIYFVLTDRFADGDAKNNDQGAGEYDPKDPAKYHGGDLRGLAGKLDYIRGLGASAVWITPPVANRWWAPQIRFSGYHGYWAEHFMKVDRHLGSLQDYQRLSHELHDRGMYLVQDIVVNHTGDFFYYGKDWDERDPARGYMPNPDARGVAAPSQHPFSLNDPRKPAHRKAGIYHWTPDVRDYTDVQQERTFQMSGLDDLNTENPVVRDKLRESYGYWIREVGVDAFRVDTAFYVAPEFYADFLHARRWRQPGILEAGRRSGRRAFHVFGEGFGIDRPGETRQAEKIEGYMRSAGGQPLLPGMLNFPLYGSLNQVFARGAPTSELAFRIASTMRVHRQPHLMPTFIDNHDVDRFLAGGNEAGLKQALLALMTLPGIPVIYYGTEQGFTEQRAAMFAAGLGAGGRDHYDATHPLYRFIAAATALRREHRVLSRGMPRGLHDNAAGPGALVWAMEGGGESERLFVAFNSAEHAVLVDNVDLQLQAGTALDPLFAIDGRAPVLVSGRDGRVSFTLPPRAGFVWKAGAQTAAAAGSAGVVIDRLATPQVSGDFSLSGQAQGVASFRLVTDGRLHEAQTVTPGADGRWQATVDTAAMVNPAVRHRVVALAEGSVSEPVGFFVRREWALLADVEDPAGDDHGPAGTYRYPLDPTWGAHRQLDIRRLRLFGSGGALRIELTMNEVTRSWNPANGFDHVAFTIFLELPGRPGGATVMPRQNARLPPGMQWHLRLRTGGWSNALFSSAGASATEEGTRAGPAPGIEVDAATQRVILTLPAAALGGLKSLSGVKVYATTWDYDGGYRELATEPRGSVFGGGSSARDPLIMDDVPVITLR